MLTARAQVNCNQAHNVLCNDNQCKQLVLSEEIPRQTKCHSNRHRLSIEFSFHLLGKSSRDFNGQARFSNLIR